MYGLQRDKEKNESTRRMNQDSRREEEIKKGQEKKTTSSRVRSWYRSTMLVTDRTVFGCFMLHTRTAEREREREREFVCV